MGDLGGGRHGRSPHHHTAGDADSPLFTPPGTPPPPYGGSTCDVASATAGGDWDRFDHEVWSPEPRTRPWPRPAALGTGRVKELGIGFRFNQIVMEFDVMCFELI